MSNASEKKPAQNKAAAASKRVGGIIEGGGFVYLLRQALQALTKIRKGFYLCGNLGLGAVWSVDTGSLLPV
ncbi:hypothetical protein NL676_028023 [Syzygium grande]|nr:hypothetical protein NL676_028023 [Syzygium grande]